MKHPFRHTHLLILGRFVLCYIIIPLLGTELFFRYYYYRWNAGLTVPFVLFSRPFPYSDDITNFITVSNIEGIMFELKPNVRSQLLNQPFYTNSQGFIGTAEYTKTKPPNTFRVIGVGDSMMSSWGIHPDDTFLSVLQHNLASQHPSKNFEIINMSVPGYNTAIEYNVIKYKALQYDPDLIILEYCGNDLDLPNHIRRRVHATSYLYFVIKTVVDMYRANSKNIAEKESVPLMNAPLSADDMTRFEYKVGEVPEGYAYMVGEDNYIKTMKNIYALTQAHGVPILLLLQNHDILQRAPEVRHIGFPIYDIQTDMDTYLPDKGMTLTDVTVGREDLHYNKLGHQLYAEFINEYFRSNSYLSVLFDSKL